MSQNQKPLSTPSAVSQSSGTIEPAAEAVRPELVPVIARHGQELVDFTLRLAAANTCIDWLMTYSITHSRVKPQVAVLMEAQADICQMLVAAKGWSWDKLAECLQDISRAAALAQPAAPGKH